MLAARLVSLVAISFTVYGCSSTTRHDHLKVLTPVDVNSLPQEFDGKKVKLNGYLIFRSDSHVLFQSKDLMNELRHGIDVGGIDFSDYGKYCITLLPNERFKASRRMRDGVNAIVIGVYESNYLDGSTVDLGACSTKGALTIIDVLEEK